MSRVRLIEPDFALDQRAEIARCCATIGAKKAKAIDWDTVALAINERSPDKPRINAEECRDIVAFYMRRYGYPRNDDGTSSPYLSLGKVVGKEDESDSDQAKVAKSSMQGRQKSVEDIGRIQGVSREKPHNSEPNRSGDHAQKAAEDLLALQGQVIAEDRQPYQKDYSEMFAGRFQKTYVEATKKDRHKWACCTM